MNEQKVVKSLYDIFGTVGLPVISGALFIAWVVNFLENPVLTFPLISILVLALYYFSGPVYSGLLMVFAVITALFGIIFVDNPFWSYLVIIESVWLICFYCVLEMYRDSYLSVKNGLLEEYETLDREIALKDSELNENRRKTQDIIQKIKNFQKMGAIMQTFEASLDEEEIIDKSGELASQFIRTGNWKLKKNTQGDIFARHIKTTGLPLIITDIAMDKRFSLPEKTEYKSVIAVPVEVNGSFWGILKGTSPHPNTFSDADLRLLSVLSGVVNTVLNNAYLYQKVQALAITDGLTGLYIQSYFKERLREEMNRAKSNKVPLSIGILDIDFFKKINDTYGHQAGDIILRQIALLLRGRFRETDLIARYGGEEFAVMMLHTDADEAVKILEEIRKSIEKERFFLPVERYAPIIVKITASIGFAELDKSSSTVEDELIKKADSALYKAKESGRNKVVEFKK